MRCDGCGRPLGLRSELECPCWLSYNNTTTDERGKQVPVIVPPRLRARTQEARRRRRG